MTTAARAPGTLPLLSQRDSYIQPKSDRVGRWLLWGASLCSEPACQISESLARVHIVDEVHKGSPLWRRFGIKCGLYVKVLLCAIVAPLLALVGMLLRRILRCKTIGMCLTNHKLQRDWNAQEKVLMWNVCAPAGGYAITDGGVLPWRERWQAIRDKIVDIDAGVVALLEVFDGAAALQMAEWLSDYYAYVYFAIGVRSLGVSSGVLLASRGPLSNVAFTPFVPTDDEGRAAFAEKGVLQFDINNKTFLLSHLRHSEEPARPTDSERNSRAHQLATITKMAAQQQGRQVLLMGDLNMEPDELLPSTEWQPCDNCQAPTWGGDSWSAEKVGKDASHAITLDYFLAYKPGPVSRPDVTVERLETGFAGAIFSTEALSDHQGLIASLKL